MESKSTLVITSISSPNIVLREFARRCKENEIPFILIGDEDSPTEFIVDTCDYYSISKQKKLPFKIAKTLPHRHYSRKNIGYLLAMQNKPEIIIETDDDNYPAESFWQTKKPDIRSVPLNNKGWINLYRFFTEEKIWPRGFPLELLELNSPFKIDIAESMNHCPIQQGLSNDNPDVDAIFRLTRKLPVKFEKLNNIALGKKSWCPFNSQNTTWFREAFPLLYLPSFCSFRVTDIWRSFIAQRICWENNWFILFHSPTVYQERNEHQLMKDFKDEVPGYLNNSEICRKLEMLNLQSGKSYIFDNMIKCYEVFINMHLIDKQEIKLLDSWIHDVINIE